MRLMAAGSYRSRPAASMKSPTSSPELWTASWTGAEGLPCTDSRMAVKAASAAVGTGAAGGILLF
jgi:hypothetical protein